MIADLVSSKKPSTTFVYVGFMLYSLPLSAEPSYYLMFDIAEEAVPSGWGDESIIRGRSERTEIIFRLSPFECAIFFRSVSLYI